MKSASRIMDSFVACTDMDEENIILSLYAKEKVSSKVVTKINHLEFNDVIHSLNLDSLIYPKHITAEYILQYVRAMKNSIGSNVETLYKLMEDRVEALEFIREPELPYDRHPSAGYENTAKPSGSSD